MTDWAQETEQRVLDAAQARAPALGWGGPLAVVAGKDCGLTEGEVQLLLPHGPADLAALKSRRHDADALAELAKVDPATLKIRERIARAAGAWLDAACAQEAATRRWAGYLALPQNLPLAGRLAWETADVLWRWAGDTATDENHYSKRAILAGVLTSALAVRLAEGAAEAGSYVDRRIADVMAFEKWKATTSFRPSAAVTRFGEMLGRLRYGAAAK
jgi:ubiquinone biosynthesis protein COQ9